QYQSTYSHIGSGLGTATVSATTITYSGTQYVKITCATSTLTHYYVAKDGDSTMHMSTYVTAEPTIGELRWIGRLNQAVLPDDDVSQASDISGGTAIEGSDIFTVNGQTRGKFYSSQRFIDDQVHCLSGSTMKACMLLPGTAYETASGGPFMRDINTNPTGSCSGIYFYMNSNHVQTESYRTGLSGPYALVFSRSGTPSASTDLSFWAGMSISGYVAASDRGRVSGKAIGIAGAIYPIVVHWYNSAAQYWTYADSASSNFASPAMKPGTYTMILYQDELKVATHTGVVVTAGSTLTHDIQSTWTTPSTTLFQIGDWDGQPTGFRNADKQLRMHPSDSRMSSWGPLTYTFGSSALDGFPMAAFKGVNDPVTIKFTLTAAQASGASTLRIGTTLSFAGGRPGVVINGKAGTNPGAPTAIDSRGVTRGAYRGRGDIYDFAVAAGGLVSGSNTITISVVSGSSGEMYLSPNFIFDAIHLFR
ncbi:putative rhamnogalacturonate lyase A, partial [Lachnellula suecica]